MQCFCRIRARIRARYLGIGVVAWLLAACATGPAMPPWPSLPVIPPPVPSATPPPEDMPFVQIEHDVYILLMGTDRVSPHESWRTDILLLAALDMDESRITLISLPRDLGVELPGYGPLRLNQIDYIGERREEGLGPQMLGAILQDYLDIELDHWLRFHMDGFAEMFDLLGSVHMELHCPFYELIWDPSQQAMEWYYIPAGELDMNANTVFLFARLRGFTSDFGRIMRQRELLWALRGQLTPETLGLLIPGLLSMLGQELKTDMEFGYLLELVRWGMSLEQGAGQGLSLDYRFVENVELPSGAQVLRIKNPAQVQSLLDEQDRYAWTLGVQDVSACRLPHMTDREFQRISILDNIIPSILPVGSTVQLIEKYDRPISLRDAPGLASDVYFTLDTGTLLTVTASPLYREHPVPADNHRWYFVETEDGFQGWVSGRFLSLLPQ